MGRITQALLRGEVDREAVISDCGQYRYELTRSWGAGRLVNFVMLNPSTADGTRDDPTVRRCLAFARSWGFDAVVVSNLFALRATQPEQLWQSPDPVGPDNDSWIACCAGVSDMVICAWGNLGRYRDRAAAVRRLLEAENKPKIHCLGCTMALQPRHPLYLAASISPLPWT
jgi:hypothetical protein